VLRDLNRIHSHICSVAYAAVDTGSTTPAPEIAESDPITLIAPNSKTNAK